jgi:hypothetical protein
MSEDQFPRDPEIPPDARGRFELTSALIAGALLLWLVTMVRFVPSTTLTLLALVVLGGIGFAWTPLIVFLFLGTILFEIPNHFLGIVPNFDSPLSLKEVMLSAVYVIYASLCYQYSRSRGDNFDLPSQRGLLTSASDVLPRSRVVSLFLTLCGGVLIAGVARWLLPFLYIGRRWGNVFQLHPAVLGFLFALLLIGLMSFLWPAVVRAFGRWGMNKHEGEMILNESLFRDLRPDISRMVRHIQRFARRK